MKKSMKKKFVSLFFICASFTLFSPGKNLRAIMSPNFEIEIQTVEPTHPQPDLKFDTEQKYLEQLWTQIKSNKIDYGDLLLQLKNAQNSNNNRYLLVLVASLLSKSDALQINKLPGNINFFPNICAYFASQGYLPGIKTLIRKDSFCPFLTKQNMLTILKVAKKENLKTIKDIFIRKLTNLCNQENTNQALVYEVERLNNLIELIKNSE